MPITIQQAMRTINTFEGGKPKPFSLEYVTFDSNNRRCKGRSELKKISNAVRVKSSHREKKAGTFTCKALNTPGLVTAHVKLVMKLNGEEVW